ncbi:MAG: acyl-CoA desaturase [Chitinophagaceae bacterium]|nr:acyl-CoA desaturase [Chitinophagaceae bacterium]
MVTPKFSTVSNPLHVVLKNKVNEYFAKTGKSTTGDAKLFTKALILFGLWTAVYIHLVFFTPAVWLAITECSIFGFLTACIGFNVMHDGAHGSFSNSPVINKIAAFSLNFLGGNAFMWNMKHNVIHHAYTNIDGIDDDLDARPFLRMASSQKAYKMHKYQYVYFWAVYSLLYLYWIFFSDFKKYFRNKVGEMPLKKMDWKDHTALWFFKLLFFFMFIAVPIYNVGVSSWVIGFLSFTMVAGLVLSIVFQLAHTVEHTHFPMPDADNNKLNDEWVVHQLKTTANFATGNKVISWLVGGLNFQIEHHLFPKISHVHYPAISKIIKEICQERNVQYVEYRKMGQAVKSHIAYLRKVGAAA